MLWSSTFFLLNYYSLRPTIQMFEEESSFWQRSWRFYLDMIISLPFSEQHSSLALLSYSWRWTEQFSFCAAWTVNPFFQFLPWSLFLNPNQSFWAQGNLIIWYNFSRSKSPNLLCLPLATTYILFHLYVFIIIGCACLWQGATYILLSNIFNQLELLVLLLLLWHWNC